MASSAVASGTRRMWASAAPRCAAVRLASSSGPAMASVPTGENGANHDAVTTAHGIANASTRSTGEPVTLRAVEHRTRPATRSRCLRHSNWATIPPIENPTGMTGPVPRVSSTAATSSAQSSRRKAPAIGRPLPWPRRSIASTR
jgi:hypothetical protein